MKEVTLIYEKEVNKIVHFSKWKSIHAAKKFFESPEIAQIRKEAGVNKGQHFELGSYEVASRLAFFITGSTPDLELLKLAQSREILTAQKRAAETLRLLNTNRGKQQIIHINEELFRMSKKRSNQKISELFKKESELLINKVLIEDRLPWKNLFVTEGTFVNRELASNYGMISIHLDDTFKWVNYDQSKRTGILSLGSYLSNGYSGEEEELTSPIKRGLQIVEDLLCMHMPPPSDIDVDNDPAAQLSDLCNIQARKATTLHPNSSCYNCHNFMEPLGLGLERFNSLGQYRTVEKSRRQCSTITPGLINGKHFNSMKTLGQHIKNEPRLNFCLTKRVGEYAFGNKMTDFNAVSLLNEAKVFESNETFQNLMLDIASSPQFLRRDISK